MDIPVPRSYSVILSEVLDAFLARQGLPSLQVGSPVLSIFEAAAQSDFRSSQDFFGLLNSLSLDLATGTALDRIAADEGTARIPEGPSTGTGTVSDPGFTKIQTRVYQGGSAPVIGTTALVVEDGSLFTPTGSLYIGRGTTNYEGPIAYTAVTAGPGNSYYTITLSSGTTRFHNLGETVILAQGGNRAVPAGTLIQTPQGNAITAVQFATVFAATIPDGETSTAGVQVQCRTPGVVGNVSSGTLTIFLSPPFTGAVFTNPTAFSNGVSTESDQALRERIRALRQSRSRGTALALKTSVLGVVAPDENKRILSSSIVNRLDEPVQMVVDDGSGYEEQSLGVPFETVMESALGGEQYFQLAQGRPVARASLTTSLQAPFSLVDNTDLIIEVGGVSSSHTFAATDFRAIATAGAYEVVASINADPTLLWSARLSDSGTRVTVFGRSGTNENLSGVGGAANLGLGIPVVEAETLWLYKNDVLLRKDGGPATVYSAVQSQWLTVASGDTLVMAIDGIPFTATVTDSSWVDAGTGYVTTAAGNSLEAWAVVLNSLLPGVSVSVAGAQLAFTSNSGRSNRARISITGGAVASALFNGVASDDRVSQGQGSDYGLDPNLGTGKLVTRLVAGDRLTAGSAYTRGFAETPAFSSLTVDADATSTADTGAELWVVVDGGAVAVRTGAGIGTAVTVTVNAAPAWGDRIRYTVGTSAFSNVVVGDWLIVTDPALNVANRGAFRVVAQAATWLEVERGNGAGAAEGPVSLTAGGFWVVRTPEVPQRLFVDDSVTAGVYTPSTLATALNSQLRGATASTYRTNRVRIRTNSFSSGDISIVAGNAAGLLLGFPTGEKVGGPSHLASVVAGHTQAGTPEFDVARLSAVASTLNFSVTALNGIASDSVLVGLKTPPEAGGDERYGNWGHQTTIDHLVGTDVYSRDSVVKEWLVDQALYAASPYRLTGRDKLELTLDADDVSGRYVLSLYRRLKPTTSTYGASNVFTDTDNSGLSLSSAFGTSVNWRDFSLQMRARQIAKAILWRYYRHGPEGETARLQYIYPDAPNQTQAVLGVDTRSSDWVELQVALGSAGPRTGYGLRNGSRIGVVSSAAGIGPWSYTYFFNLPVATASRVIKLNYTQSVPFINTEVVTGAGGAFGTIDSGAGTGTWVLTGVVGTFVNGEVLTGNLGGVGTAVGTQYGVSTLTPDIGVLTDHGFQVGDVLWLESNNVNFSSGVKVLTARTTTTVSYVDTAVAVGATANIGSLSFDNGGEVNTGGAGIIVGDILSTVNCLGFPASYRQSMRIDTVTAGKLVVTAPVAGDGVTTITWAPVNLASNLSVFQLGANTSTTVVADIGTTGAVVGTDLTPGSAITKATWDDVAAPASNWYYYLKDGCNWVRSYALGAGPTYAVTFTFKDDIAPELATGSDWANEDVRLVPITAANVVAWLQAEAVSGLSSRAELQAAAAGRAPQVTTVTVGGDGSVGVGGGSGNSVTAAVIGSGVVVGTEMVAAALASEVEGLGGNSWVRLQNAAAAPKSVISSATNLDSLAADGWLTLSAGPDLWTELASAGSQVWQVEKQGDFVSFVSPTAVDLSAATEGDWVHVTGGTISSLNQGWFRLVRMDASGAGSGADRFWVENSQGLAEVKTAIISVYGYDSCIPGDTLTIGTSLWGSGNLGTWTIAALDAANQKKIRLDVSARTPEVVTAPGPAALGTSSGLVVVREGQPTRLYKKVVGLAPISDTEVDLKFSTSPGYRAVGSSYGTVLTVLDKLNFGIDSSGAALTLVPGIDGYRHSTGLLAEANKVVYGDDNDTSSYPGVAAAGAQIDINGPLVRRIFVSLALRVQTGVSYSDISTAVRSAVTAVINNTGVGAPVSLSAVVAAAQACNGVVAVTLTSPSYGVGSDLISVQPQEKPMVLDSQQDVQVSFVGN